MNLHITQEQFNVLLPICTEKYVIGSQYYGFASEDSDTDILCVYDQSGLDISALNHYGIFSNIQLQYKDLENNVDYVFTTRPQFWGNLLSGDSQINLEVALLELQFQTSYFISFKILRGLLGVAKRDWKSSNYDLNKLKHARKMLYIAKEIYYDGEVSKDIIKDIFTTIDEQLIDEKQLVSQEIANFRDLIAKDLNDKKLFSYAPAFIKHLNDISVNDPTSLIINNLNTTIFKYD